MEVKVAMFIFGHPDGFYNLISMMCTPRFSMTSKPQCTSSHKPVTLLNSIIIVAVECENGIY